MATKKSSKPSKSQLKQLASRLIDSRRNAYHEAKVLGFVLDEESWEAMEKQEKIFRCEECSQWLAEDCKAYPGAAHCDDCEGFEVTETELE
jgi:hypothetical protein